MLPLLFLHVVLILFVSMEDAMNMFVLVLKQESNVMPSYHSLDSVLQVRNPSHSKFLESPFKFRSSGKSGPEPDSGQPWSGHRPVAVWPVYVTCSSHSLLFAGSYCATRRHILTAASAVEQDKISSIHDLPPLSHSHHSVISCSKFMDSNLATPFLSHQSSNEPPVHNHVVGASCLHPSHCNYKC